MAFNNRRSWRMKFINIDSSFQIRENDSPVIGYFAIRAPKGNIRPFYFGSGNENAIEALVGPASADWPDIAEVQAFNKEYPVYVSASPGSSNAYPSYLGGFYFTKDGIYKFYNVTSIEDINEHTGNAFKVKVQPGKEYQFNKKFLNKGTKITVAGPDIPDYSPAPDQFGYGLIELKNTNPENSGEGHDNTSYISFKKNSALNVTEIDYDTMNKGLVSGVGTDKTYWDDNEGLWDFAGNTAKLNDFGFKFTADDRAQEGFSAFKQWIGEANYNNVTEPEDIAKLLINGYVTVDDVNYTIAFGIQDNFSFLVDIYEDVYALFSQKSPTETPTTVNITKVGYDKYYYNMLLSYAPYDVEKYEATGKLYVLEDENMNETEKAKMLDTIERNKYVAFYEPVESGEKKIKFIGRFEEDDDGSYFYDKVGATDLINKYVALQDAITGGKIPELFHKFFKIFSEGKGILIKRVYTLEEAQELYGQDDGALFYEKGVSTNECVPQNPDFNQIELSCSEIINAKNVSGGQWIGSLDPLGKNTYGALNYWPQILADDDATFILTRIYKKFGDNVGDLDSNGFWQHSRIIDPNDIDKDGNSPTQKKIVIEGDRYTTLVMEENKILNKQGGEWNDKYSSMIRESLIEATMPDYDDAWVFVECTGQEEFKSYLANISNAQQNAAVISPKILSPNSRGLITKELAAKVTVTGRVNQASNAQFAGEFKVYDTATKQYYWRKPIGSVGLMIARIMDKNLGGAAPAWQNSGGVGGQLFDVDSKEARYKFEDTGSDEDATKILDNIGINPIVYTSEEGVMIVSQKTTQDPNFPSDWSYLGHSLSFQVVRREIRDKVMRPQIMKPIIDYWMAKRQEAVEGILGTRTFWAKATCDIFGQNNEYTKAQKNFIIRVDIWVEPWSEVVTLVLDNHSIVGEKSA